MTDQTAHPPEWMLHAYLDDELAAEERRDMETHLAACPACAAQLAELESLFATIESLPPTPLARDLAPAVLREIKETSSVSARLRWIAGIELAAAALLLALVLPALSRPFSSLALGVKTFLGLSLLSVQAWLTQADGWLSLGRDSLFSRPFIVPVQTELLLWALIPGALFWLLVNALLLRGGRRGSRFTK